MSHWLSRVDRLVVVTNNDCNLTCPRCDTGSNLGVGSHHFQRKTWRFNPHNLEKLLEAYGDVIPRIRLHGGETTILPAHQVEVAVKSCEAHDIPVQILTNGYGLLEYPMDLLNRFELIVLNGHGINEAHLDNVYKHLDIYCEADLDRLKRYDYFDFKQAVEESPKTGKVCVLYNKIAALYLDVLWPCCGPFYSNQDINQVMRDFGWSVHHPDFKQATEDLDNLPMKFWDTCRAHCWGNAIDPPTINIKDLVGGRPHP